jgi:hypothetical protein
MMATWRGGAMPLSVSDAVQACIMLSGGGAVLVAKPFAQSRTNEPLPRQMSGDSLWDVRPICKEKEEN